MTRPRCAAFLGAGRRLFQGTLPERRLSLVESRVYPPGLVRLVYRPT